MISWPCKIIIKEGEMGDTCSMHRWDEKCVKNFSQIVLRSSCLGDIGLDERIILK
jgi:hypothetical protein